MVQEAMQESYVYISYKKEKEAICAHAAERRRRKKKKSEIEQVDR